MLRTFRFSLEIPHSMPYGSKLSPLSLPDWLLWHEEWCHCTLISFILSYLSSPKGLRAESARAVTGRRCPHSGEGEDFLMGQLNFFTKTAVTPERKVKKSIPRWEMNGLSEGYKWVIGENWGRMSKIGFLAKNRDFGPKKMLHFCTLTMFWPRPEKVVQRKKVPLPK